MSQAIDVTDSTWDTTVLQSDVPVLVDFWAEWCGPCRAMSPYVDKLAEELNGQLTVVKMNTSENLEIPARYSVTSIPTFLLIKNGEVAHQIVGSQQYAEFKKTIESNL